MKINLQTETKESQKLPNSEYEQYIRIANTDDIPGVLELWGNYASLRQLQDYINWSWAASPTLIWQDVIQDLLQDKYHMLTIADFQDNGLTGFVLAHVQEMPRYYNYQYRVVIQEFYIRPKEKCPTLLRDMIVHTIDQLKVRLGIVSNGQIVTQIEMLEHERTLLRDLMPNNNKLSSLKITLDI